jgi:hypothetical protein
MQYMRVNALKLQINKRQVFNATSVCESNDVNRLAAIIHFFFFFNQTLPHVAVGRWCALPKTLDPGEMLSDMALFKTAQQSITTGLLNTYAPRYKNIQVFNSHNNIYTLIRVYRNRRLRVVGNSI